MYIIGIIYNIFDVLNFYLDIYIYKIFILNIKNIRNMNFERNIYIFNL